MFKKNDRVQILIDSQWQEAKILSFVFHSPITKEDYYEVKIAGEDLVDFYPESQLRKHK